MGGRLDSTNVIEAPELAIITAIGYDHVKELGPTIKDIAGEKAGIIKQGGDVLVYGGEPDVVEVFERVSQERGASLSFVDFCRITNQEFSLDGIKFGFEPYGRMRLALIGAYQPKNAAVAITAVEMLRNKSYDISNENIIHGIESVRWPGRFEVLGYAPVFILDGSHNPQGMEAAAESLRCHFSDLSDKKVIFIIGVMADKDLDAMIPHIIPFAKAFITVKPDNPRAMESRELAEKLKRFGVQVVDCGAVNIGVSEALNMAGEDDVVCAMGSLYFSAEVREAYSGQ
jgi:dihydrofolate synthase/folylpolyglutamate synthase